MQTARALSLETTRVEEAQAPSLAALYEQRAQLTPQAIACRSHDAASGEWIDWSWTVLQARAARYAAGLQQHGLRAGDRVGILLPNGADWLAIDYAAHSLGLVVVGLYGEDTPANTAWMLTDAGVKLAFLRDADSWNALQAEHRLPELGRAVLLAGTPSPGDLRAQPLDAWLPAASRLPALRIDGEALASIVYTSGSTGRSKGVMLSHANILSNAFACLRAIGVRADDVVLSVLPLTHLFERTAGAYLAIAAGMRIVYGRGPAFIAEDLRTQQPTVLLAVPRLFERVHGALAARLAAAPAAKRALFRLAVEAGWQAQRKGAGALKVHLLPTALSRRAGADIRERLGGRLRLAICGGAALSPDIARIFIGLGVPVLHGYGLTEAGPVVSVNRIGDNDPASAGLPLDNVEIRVGHNGELQVRGPGVMMGYWNDKDATRDAIDESGWLRTGDKVSRLDCSRVFLTGRIKELIITATGEKSAPTDIEQQLRGDALIDQVMVVGEARPYLSALIVADPAQLALLRARLGLKAGDDEVAARERIEQALLQLCEELQRHAPRNHKIRRVALVRAPWTAGNGLLTASQKLRRNLIARHQSADIERLYAGHFSAPKTDCSCNAEA